MTDVVYDLDGVLRDLNIYLMHTYGVPYPDVWHWKHEGKTIFQWIRHDNYRVLRHAPRTGYLDVALRHEEKMEIWTSQPEKWIPHTKIWIENNIGDCIVRFMTRAEKEKRAREENKILLEDNPSFKSFDNIVLVNRPYNTSVQNVRRVRNPSHLDAFLRGRGGKG